MSWLICFWFAYCPVEHAMSIGPQRRPPVEHEHRYPHRIGHPER